MGGERWRDNKKGTLRDSSLTETVLEIDEIAASCMTFKPSMSIKQKRSCRRCFGTHVYKTISVTL